MNILLELKKRFSPHGVFRLNLRKLKAIKSVYPNSPIVKKGISILRKKQYCLPTPNAVRNFRRKLKDLYIKELSDEGKINNNLWIFNDLLFYPCDCKDYVESCIQEYIDIVLSDMYLKRKLEQSGNQNESLIANVLSSFPIEGPYQYHKVFLNEGDVIIDAGANVGMFSLFAAKYYNCKCYAFEPCKIFIPIMEKNIHANLLDNYITVCPLGLSDTSSVEIFRIDGIGSTFVRHANIIDIETDNIQCVSLDSWVEENKISKIDFIKADIEGAERLFLKGAAKVLKELQPKLSICTYHLPDDKQVLTKIIKDANPNYVIIHTYLKLYAYVPEKG